MDELKIEAKHTIDIVRFVDKAEIDSRYWEKPYYLIPDGDEADEGYVVIRNALKEARKVGIGQLIMHSWALSWRQGARQRIDALHPSLWQ